MATLQADTIVGILWEAAILLQPEAGGVSTGIITAESPMGASLRSHPIWAAYLTHIHRVIHQTIRPVTGEARWDMHLIINM